MATFKAALVAVDGNTVPEWLLTQMKANGIDLVIRHCFATEDLLETAAEADLVWIFGGSAVVTAESLHALRQCGAILRTRTGTDNVPVAEATALGIVVATTPAAGTDTVAEHAAALILAVLRQVAVQDRLVRSGVWDRDRAWPRWRLQGQTLRLLGFGAIARRLCAKLAGFDLSVIAFDPFIDADRFDALGVGKATLGEVLASANILSLHCPLTAETYHLIGEAELRSMRSDAILINTARGDLVDEHALGVALSEGWISGAGLDVLEHEPTDVANPLLALANLTVTPHIAGYLDTFYEDSWKLSVETVIDIANGRWPRSCANPGVVPRRALAPYGRRDPQPTS